MNQMAAAAVIVVIGFLVLKGFAYLETVLTPSQMTIFIVAFIILLPAFCVKNSKKK